MVGRAEGLSSTETGPASTQLLWECQMCLRIGVGRASHTGVLPKGLSWAGLTDRMCSLLFWPGEAMFDSCIDSLFSVGVEIPPGDIGHHQETFLIVTLRRMQLASGGQRPGSMFSILVYRIPCSHPGPVSVLPQVEESWSGSLNTRQGSLAFLTKATGWQLGWLRVRGTPSA